MTPSPVELAAWLVCLVAAATGVNQLLRLTDRLKPKPPPEDTYVTREVCAKLHDHQDSRIKQVECAVGVIRTEMKTDRTELERAGEARSVALHDRINAVLAAVSELKGEIRRMGRARTDTD